MNTFTVGDLINFTGNTHFPTADSQTDGKSCKYGLARIDEIALNKINPYHIIAEPYGYSDVYGWVPFDSIEKLTHEELIETSINRLAYLQVINSPEYWKNFVKLKKVLNLDYLFIKAAKIITEVKERIFNPHEGIDRLISAGIITMPEYWNQMAYTHTNIGALLQALGSSINVNSLKHIKNSEDYFRNKVVSTAQSYLGFNEWDGSHEEIIDLYNSVEPLPQNYKVSYYDSWCATFVSAVAIKADCTDIIPRECGCERQINLFKEMGRFKENENYVPKPGDIIYYSWTDSYSDYAYTDLKDFADHVGIVVSVEGSEILVIEGNKHDCVEYRTIYVNGRFIRGYGLPNYAAKVS